MKSASYFAAFILLFSLTTVHAAPAGLFPSLGLVSVAIDSVHPDFGQLELTLNGSLPDPCYRSPTPVALFDENEPNTIVIRMISVASTGICIQRLGSYSTVINLPEVVRSSNLPVDPNATYILRTEGFDFSMPVAGSALVY